MYVGVFVLHRLIMFILPGAVLALFVGLKQPTEAAERVDIAE